MDQAPTPTPDTPEDDPHRRGWWLVSLLCVLAGLTSLTLSVAVVYVAVMHDQHFGPKPAELSDLTRRLSPWRGLVPVPSAVLTGLAIAAMAVPRRRRRFGALGLVMILVVQIWLGLAVVFLYLPMAANLSTISSGP
jgi:hypothetical protein